MQCSNNNNDEDFLGRGFGNHFGKYLKALFELYECHYHRNVIIIRTNKAREYRNLSLYRRVQENVT